MDHPGGMLHIIPCGGSTSKYFLPLTTSYMLSFAPPPPPPRPPSPFRRSDESILRRLGRMVDAHFFSPRNLRWSAADQLKSAVWGVNLESYPCKVSEEEMRELLALETELSVEEILLYRSVAR